MPGSSKKKQDKAALKAAVGATPLADPLLRAEIVGEASGKKVDAGKELVLYIADFRIEYVWFTRAVTAYINLLW